MYKTEAHVHTAEVSRCGQVGAEEIVRIYAEAGFHTVFITDHINIPTLARLGDGLTWCERMDRFMAGYLAAKAAGERLGVTVLFGVEINFAKPEGCPNDYLVYGLDIDFLKGMPDLNLGSLEEFYRVAKAHGALVIQAHPYRGGACYPTPGFIDGVEVYNAHPRHTNFNERALMLAGENPRLLRTVGSDFHMACDAARAYIITDYPIETVEDYIRAVREGSARFVTPEE